MFIIKLFRDLQYLLKSILRPFDVVSKMFRGKSRR